jgi:hypothetical protein
MSSFTSAYLEAMLDLHFRDIKQKRAWYSTPHPGLGNQTPNDLLAKGRDESVCNFVKNSMKVPNVNRNSNTSLSVSSNRQG